MLKEIKAMRRHLESWMRTERVPVPWVQRPGRGRIVRQPLGVVLVIAPWNLPVQLLLPMAAVVAAGNSVSGKPSEVTPNTSRVLAELSARYLDPDAATANVFPPWRPPNDLSSTDLYLSSTDLLSEQLRTLVGDRASRRLGGRRTRRGTATARGG